MALCGLGGERHELDAHPSNVALDLPLGGHLTGDCLDRRLGLLDRCFVAVLRRQCAVVPWSELGVRLEPGWARELTRHPRSRQAVLPSGSW